MPNPSPAGELPRELAAHQGYSRVFQPQGLTFGFITPLEAYPDHPAPTMTHHAELVRKADKAGFSAVWLRDVPFYDPHFGDVGQIFDPMAYAAYLAAITGQITIGTAGAVLPLRDPLILAKQAATVDQLSGGRFVLGLATGDRATEYPAFGCNYENRAARFRDALAMLRAATEEAWPIHRSEFYGQLEGTLQMVPQPTEDRLPMIVIGHAGQSLEWTAQNTDGILSYTSDPHRIDLVIAQWRAACPAGLFKPYGYGTLFNLDRDPNMPIRFGRILHGGRNALLEYWLRQQDAGVSHAALHFKPQRRPVSEVLDELGEYLLPHFPSHKPGVPAGASA